MKFTNYLCYCAAIVALSFYSCTKDPTPIDCSTVINQAGITATSQEKHDITSQEVTDNGIVYNLETHSVVDNIFQITNLGLNDDILWCGNIIKGTTISSFNYSPILIDRAPITLSINLEGSNIGGVFSTTVEDPKLSTVRQGINDIIVSTVGLGVEIPAKVNLEKTRVYSESQMDLAVGADISYGSVDLKSKFNFSSSSTKTRIIAKYKQIYFTINVDTPNSPCNFFDSSVSTDDALAAIPAGSQPVYVSGVSYGAMAMMFIESDYSEEIVNAALDASYSGLSVDVNVTSTLTARSVFANSKTSVVVYGGSTEGVKQFSQLNLDEFFAFVNASSKFTTGSDAAAVPLVYTFRHLVDNTLAQVALTSDYTIRVPYGTKYRVSITEIIFSNVDDEGDDDLVEIDRLNVQIVGYQKTDALALEEVLTSLVPYPGGAAPTYLYNYADGGDGHVVGSGSTIPIDGSFWLPQYYFDNKNHNFDLAGFRFVINARDYDSNSDDEYAGDTFNLSSSSFLSDQGIHKYTIICGDFHMTTTILVEAI